MSTASKVAYLSKYLTSENNDDISTGKGRRSNRSKKKKSKAHVQDGKVKTSRNNQLVQMDDDQSKEIYIQYNEKEELVDTDDDNPVLVNSEEIDLVDDNNISEHVPRGTWQIDEFQTEKNDYESKKQQRRRHDSDTSDSDASQRDTWKRKSDDLTVKPDENGLRMMPKENRRRRRHDSDSEASHDGIIRSDKAQKSSIRPNHDGHKRDHVKITGQASIVSSTSKNVALSNQHDNNHASGRYQRDERHDLADSSDDDKSRTGRQRERMSSGHKSGMQTGTDFSRREMKLQRTKIKATEDFIRNHGVSGETVYRDRDSGRILEKRNGRHEHHQDHKSLTSEEQRILNSGRVQLEREEQLKRDYEKIQNSSFARHRDDSELEKSLKEKIYADDPMAAYAVKKQVNKGSTRSVTDITASGSSQIQRPTYKGPPPTPNRFNIQPGYRWDARDRGNGFESKLLAKKYNAEYQSEKAYRYASADM